jgi:hypothetical protein
MTKTRNWDYAEALSASLGTIVYGLWSNLDAKVQPPKDPAVMEFGQ